MFPHLNTNLKKNIHSLHAQRIVITNPSNLQYSSESETVAIVALAVAS